MVPELLIPLAGLFSLVHYCISDFIPVHLAGTVRVPCPQLCGCWGTGKPFHAHVLAAPPAASPAGKALARCLFAQCLPGVCPVLPVPSSTSAARCGRRCGGLRGWDGARMSPVLPLGGCNHPGHPRQIPQPEPGCPCPAGSQRAAPRRSSRDTGV